MPKNFEIKNSTAEFLMFVMDGKENGVQVTYKDETIWCTQKAMATLFDVGVPAISKHLKNQLFPFWKQLPQMANPTKLLSIRSMLLFLLVTV